MDLPANFTDRLRSIAANLDGNSPEGISALNIRAAAAEIDRLQSIEIIARRVSPYINMQLSTVVDKAHRRSLEQAARLFAGEVPDWIAEVEATESDKPRN